LYYQEGCGDLKLDSDFNLAFDVKNIDCGLVGEYVASGSQDSCQDPRLTGPLSGLAYGMTLRADSPGIDSGDYAICPLDDLLGRSRPTDGDLDGRADCDRGAYEHEF
jgi:hypothetical protein